MILTIPTQPTFQFPLDVTLKAHYRNSGKDEWRLKTPDQSGSVLVRFAPVARPDRPYEYFMATRKTVTVTTPSGKTITAFESLTPAALRIPPKEQFTFSTTLNGVWTGLLVPGEWLVWVVDEEQKIESERAKLRIEVNGQSFPVLLERAADDQEPLSKRKWHAEWLQKVKPDLKLDWPRRDDPEAVRKQKEYRVQLALKEFERFWEREKDSQAVADAIRKINEDAGLKADE